jgi:hypothetical protein
VKLKSDLAQVSGLASAPRASFPLLSTRCQDYFTSHAEALRSVRLHFCFVGTTPACISANSAKDVCPASSYFAVSCRCLPISYAGPHLEYPAAGVSCTRPPRRYASHVQRGMVCRNIRERDIGPCGPLSLRVVLNTSRQWCFALLSPGFLRNWTNSRERSIRCLSSRIHRSLDLSRSLEMLHILFSRQLPFLSQGLLTLRSAMTSVLGV